jgi:hypothetical protein
LPAKWISRGAWGYSVAGFSEGLAGVGSGKKYGFIDKTGNMVIPLQDNLGSRGFSEGPAGVTVGNKWGFIDKTGKMVWICRQNWDVCLGANKVGPDESEQ